MSQNIVNPLSDLQSISLENIYPQNSSDTTNIDNHMFVSNNSHEKWYTNLCLRWWFKSSNELNKNIKNANVKRCKCICKC